MKFGLDPIDPVSILSLAASLDPRSRGLTYLSNDKSQTALKQELLQQLIIISSDKESNSIGKRKLHHLLRRKKSDKDNELEFFWRGFFK